MNWNLEYNVGTNGPNASPDVQKVVTMLAAVPRAEGGSGAGGSEPSGPDLIAAIGAFQKKQFGGWWNGSVAPDSATLLRLQELGLTPWERQSARAGETQRERICRVAEEKLGLTSDAGKRPYQGERRGWESLKRIFDDILLEPFDWNSKYKAPYHCKMDDKDYDLTFLEGVQRAHMRVPRGDPKKSGIHWCGIFALWVWSQAGLGRVKWSRRKGGPRVGDGPLKASSKKNAFLPGDIGVIPTDTHHFIFVSRLPDRQRLVTVDGNWGNQEIVKMPGGPGDIHLLSQVRYFYSVDTAVYDLAY